MTARMKKAPHVASPEGSLMGWAREGVHSFVAAQKILMDLAAHEKALLVGMVRERIGKPGFRPGASMVGITATGVRNLTNVGKILLDLAADETALAFDAVKEGIRLPVMAGTMSEVLRHRVDTLISLQKCMLDVTAEQAHALAESYQKGEGMPAATSVVELTRRGIEGFVEREKKFLDLAAHEVSVAVRGGKRTNKEPRKRIEVLTTVAREGVDKYIETQKKLLDLAIDQLEATVEVARGRKKAAQQEARPLLKELTGKSVANIVAAEKSLLELAKKPMKRASREEARKGARTQRRAHYPAKKQMARAHKAAA